MLRIVVLSFRQFKTDNGLLRASALTFYSLLSIVPVFAMAFGVAKGFGLEKKLETEVLSKMPGQEEAFRRIIEFAQNMLENTRGGLVAGIGVIFLVWVVIKLLGNIELAFNVSWGVQKSRSLGRKFTDYMSLMLICPLLFIMSGSLNVFIVSQVTLITEKITLLGYFSPLIMTSLKLLPFAVIWVLFSFLYIYMPNTRVKWSSGIVAGIVAGTLYQIVQSLYIHFQIGAAKYGAIYGSFAALPLFLIWLQISWIVVMFGAQISFACQNVDTFEYEADCVKASFATRRLMALRIMHLLLNRFETGEDAYNDVQISDELEIPVRLVRFIIEGLIQSKLVSEVRKDDFRNIGYQPATSTETMTIKKVLDALDRRGVSDIPVKEDAVLSQIQSKLHVLDKEMEASYANVLLKDLPEGALASHNDSRLKPAVKEMKKA
jgi:membrane protein